MFGQNSYSLADIAAATGSSRSGDGMWGDSGAWWIIILFLFCFAGNGWGGNSGGAFGGANGVTDGYILASDFSTLERKIDTVNGGLCDGFYAMNTGMLNGFAGVNAAIQQSTVAGMQNTNQLMSQLNAMSADAQACCCSTQRLIEKDFADLNYNMATQSCQTRQAICDSTRDIIDNQNAGVRSILDFLTQDKIAALTAENQSLKFAASQAAQNQYLVSELGYKAPVPAYTVPNPYASYFNGCGCGYN